MLRAATIRIMQLLYFGELCSMNTRRVSAGANGTQPVVGPAVDRRPRPLLGTGPLCPSHFQHMREIRPYNKQRLCARCTDHTHGIHTQSGCSHLAWPAVHMIQSMILSPSCMVPCNSLRCVSYFFLCMYTVCLALSHLAFTALVCSAPKKKTGKGGSCPQSLCPPTIMMSAS